MQENKLKYLKHHLIDYDKWDQCISEAVNSRVYATTWFLDRTALEWDALVWDDYEFVMPLPARQKLGIRYLYQPPYCQQLGIFPSPPVRVAMEFYQVAFKLFRYSDVPVNSLNQPLRNQDKIRFIPRENFLLHLGTEYDILASAYSVNTRRNMARARGNRLNYVEGIGLNDYLMFKQAHSPQKIERTVLQKLKSIIAYSQYHGMGEIAGVYSDENELCAAVYFCRWKERVIYMNAVSSPLGKENRAMFMLLDHFLETNANKNLVLDFEGSILPGVSRFFKGFGATPEVYYQLKFNRLPALVKWIKRSKDE